MIKLVIKIIACAILMAATMALIWTIPGTHPHDLAALLNKKEMLIVKPSPRMILVGGSSVLSMKSELISKELRYNVIDMSSWGGMGTFEILEEIKPYLKPADVVLVTMEYGTILDKKFYEYIHTNDEAKKFLFLMSPGRHILDSLKKREFFNLFKLMHELVQMKTKSFLLKIVTFNFSHLFDIGFPGFKDEFNANGDRIRPYMIFRPLGDSNTNFSYPEWEKLSFLNDFNDFAAKRQARVLFYFSHFPENKYKENLPYINAYYEMMKKNFRGTILNKPSDFVYPEEYFADTIYHLNEKGESVRTPEMIQLLKRAL
ncbi:MAG TPA: hypothetical protein PL180_20135 [Spirochaetota bacterium]|nr:hypothetical protein [Spirochaetota bacterium]HRS79532.1 hypothetical protein [Spirochaetota bacterium]HRT77462.1 hypothetical protein [Spirochaetota bacterium]